MKITYLGNFSAPHCTEVHVAASLEAQGHIVHRLQEDGVGLADLEAATRLADLFLWTRTLGFLRVGSEDMRSWLKSKRGVLPTVAYHLDLYAGLQRGEGLSTDPFWCAEFVFTPDGGSDAFFQRHGVNHFYLRPGVYDKECVAGAPRKDLEADVVFVGSGSVGGDYHPEWGYRRELLRFLGDTYGPRFVKHGGPPMNGGRDFIRGKDLSDLYASAKVVVGDTLCLGPEDQIAPRFQHARYWSDRVYETVGRGGYLIHPRIDGLEEEFKDGEHLRFYTYGDFEGLRSIIDESLQDRALRDRVKGQGLERVKSACTYVHRTAEMLKAVTGAAHKDPKAKIFAPFNRQRHAEEMRYWETAAAASDGGRSAIWGVQGRWEEDIQPCLDVCVQPILDALRASGAPPGARVVDLGCGVGRLAVPAALSAPSVHILGVDASLEMLKQLRNRVDALGITNIEGALCNGFSLPPEAQGVHAVYSMITFQHIPWGGVRAYFHAVALALLPQGVFHFQIIVGDQAEPFSHHFPMDRVSQGLEEEGFVLEKVEQGLIHPLWTWITARKVH